MTDTPDLADLNEQVGDLEDFMLIANAEREAMKKAFLALLMALDDTLPATRTIVLDTLREAIDTMQQPTAYIGSEAVHEAQIDALADLAAHVQLDSQLIEIDEE